MADFSIAYKITHKNESGWVNHPADRGGETYNGISRKYYPLWNGWLIVDKYKRLNGFPENLNGNEAIKEQEFTFFKKNFWDVNKLDKIYSQEIANEVFDTGVNMGYRVAAEFLQKSYNLLSKNESDYKKIEVDGVIGSKTLSAINNHPYPRRILKTLNILQGAKYISICDRNPDQEAFFAGWIERVTV